MCLVVQANAPCEDICAAKGMRVSFLMLMIVHLVVLGKCHESVSTWWVNLLVIGLIR